MIIKVLGGYAAENLKKKILNKKFFFYYFRLRRSPILFIIWTRCRYIV